MSNRIADEPTGFAAYRAQISQRDQYIGGYMHAAAGHANDMTRHMFATERGWAAWTSGNEAGQRGEHPERLIQPWCNAVVERAVAAWRTWLAEQTPAGAR